MQTEAGAGQADTNNTETNSIEMLEEIALIV